MKKITVILFCILLMTFIQGCASNTPASSGSKKTDGQKLTSTEQSKENSDEKASDGSLVWRVDNGFSESVDTEDGHYYIGSDENEEGETLYTIRYVDYKTRQEIYLCNQPNCKHDSKACNAVLPEEAASGSYCLIGDENYLYLSVTPTDNAGSMQTVETYDNAEEIFLSTSETIPPAIYRMKFDGTEREKIFSMDSGNIMEPIFFTDDNALYMLTKKVSEEKEGNSTYVTGYDRKLFRLDMQNNKGEEVMDLDNEQTILGVSGRQLIIGTTDYGREVSVKEKQDDAAYKKLFENSSYIITSQNIDTKEAVELKRYKQKKLHSEWIRNGILYTSYEGKKEINLIDLATNEEQTIPTKQSYSIEYVLEKGVSRQQQDEQARDTAIIIGSPWDYSEEGYSNYLIDVKEGTEKESRLQNRYYKPISIISENSDSLFVMNDYEMVKEYVPWMDIYQDVTGKTTYGIISKKDFCENQASYEKVKVIGLGEMG